MTSQSLTSSTAAPNEVQPPRLPGSLARLVADNEFDPKGWLEPAPSQCRAFAPQIPAAIDALEAGCHPATGAQMDRCLATLVVACAPRGDETEATWMGRHAEYKRLLGDYPGDIWRAACDEWARTPDKGRWYPTVSELGGIMAGMLAKRRRGIVRLRTMLDIAKQRPKAVESGPEGRPYSELTPEQKAEHERVMASLRALSHRPAETKPKVRPSYLRDGPPAPLPEEDDGAWDAIGA